eukprot:469699-Amphidinium_carterae.1
MKLSARRDERICRYLLQKIVATWAPLLTRKDHVVNRLYDFHISPGIPERKSMSTARRHAIGGSNWLTDSLSQVLIPEFLTKFP